MGTLYLSSLLIISLKRIEKGFVKDQRGPLKRNSNEGIFIYIQLLPSSTLPPRPKKKRGKIGNLTNVPALRNPVTTSRLAFVGPVVDRREQLRLKLLFLDENELQQHHHYRLGWTSRDGNEREYRKKLIKGQTKKVVVVGGKKKGWNHHRVDTPDHQEPEVGLIYIYLIYDYFLFLLLLDIGCSSSGQRGIFYFRKAGLLSVDKRNHFFFYFFSWRKLTLRDVTTDRLVVTYFLSFGGALAAGQHMKNSRLVPRKTAQHKKIRCKQSRVDIFDVMKECRGVSMIKTWTNDNLKSMSHRWNCRSLG